MRRSQAKKQHRQRHALTTRLTLALTTAVPKTAKQLNVFIVQNKKCFSDANVNPCLFFIENHVYPGRHDIGI